MATSITLDNVTIIGKSVGGQETSIIVPTFDICFDMGVLLDDSVGKSIICISHGHCDHIGNLHTYLLRKKMVVRNDNKTTTCIMPDVCIDPFKKMLSLARSLEKNKFINADILVGYLKLNLKHLEPNCDDIFEHRNYFIKSYKMIHRVPNYAYCIFIKKNKLIDELVGKSSEEIIQAKKSGINVNKEVISSELAFTGDTVIESVLSTPDLLNVKILILECTFIDDEVSIEESKKRGHTHLYEIIMYIDKFKNKFIVLTHFSPRYKKDYILEQLDKLIPSDHRTKFHIL